jgi:hypothetical protein
MHRTASFPCLVCGRELLRTAEQMEEEPDAGVMCYTHGNYGSTVYDPFDGEYLAFNICDPCLVAAGEAGRLMATRASRPIKAYIPLESGRRLLSIVGSERVDGRPYVRWHQGLAGDGDERIFDPEVDEMAEGVHLNVSVESLRAGR